jgi:hypothetical protein
MSNRVIATMVRSRIEAITRKKGTNHGLSCLGVDE